MGSKHRFGFLIVQLSDVAGMNKAPCLYNDEEK